MVMIEPAAVETEYALALALAEGRLRSPQQFCGNVFAVLCLAETGAHVRADDGEIAFKPRDVWLSDRMLARMIGLPVVADDRGMLDSGNFSGRIVGSIIHSYTDGDRLMGVARIWHAASKPQSASLFARVDDICSVQLDDADGTRILIEGAPRCISHVAIS